MATEFDSDAMLSFLTEVTKKVADLKKEMVGVGDQAGTGIHKTTDETERFGKTVERHTKHLEGMKLEVGSIVGLLRGPVGLAAAFYGAGAAIANFARGELQLRNFATDTGLAAAAIQKMRVQLTSYGIDAKTADQQISTLTSKLDSIKTLTTASPVYKNIAANDPLLAKQLLDAERLGNRVESIRLIVDKLQTGGPRSKLYLGQELGIGQSTAAALARDTSHLVKPWIYDDAELQKFNDEWHNITQTMENVWGASMMWMTSEANRFFNEARREAQNLKDEIEKLKKDLDLEGLQKGKRPKSIPELLGIDFSKLFSTEAHAATPTGKEALLEGDASFADRFGAWSAEENALPKNARPRSFAPESVKQDELEVQKDSNQLLQDIRDLISGDKKGIGVGGVGGGGTAAGSRSGGAAAAPGAAPGGGDSAGTPGTPRRGATGAESRVPETSKDPAYGGREGDSGGLSREQYDKKFKGTPLEGQYEKVVAAAAKSNVPASLVAGIMAHETGAGTSRMLRERNNPAGLMDPKTRWQTGQTFGSIDEGIDAAARTIAKNYERGGRSIGGMANIYAPRGAANDPRGLNKFWRGSVEKYARDFAADEKRAAIDKSLVASRDLGGAKIRVDFTGDGKGGKTDTSVLDQGPFKKLKISRSPQAPSTGGGVDDFNRFAFE